MSHVSNHSITSSFAANNNHLIIVDSSVWIDYFKGIDSAYTDYLDNLLATELIGITDIILMEVLRGFRDDKAFKQSSALLLSLSCFEIITKQKALRYVAYYRALRKQGITIRKSNDVVIAGYCIDHQLPLLFADKDFLPFVEHFGLVSVL